MTQGFAVAIHAPLSRRSGSLLSSNGRTLRATTADIHALAVFAADARCRGPAMRTTLIDGVEPWLDDIAVLAAIRTLATQGFDEYLDLCHALDRLGFSHCPRGSPSGPFDDMFRAGA